MSEVLSKFDGRVFNLATGEYLTTEWSITLGARKTVIAAYAQQRCRDFNTADYETKYGHLVKEGNVVFNLGDFSTFK